MPEMISIVAHTYAQKLYRPGIPFECNAADVETLVKIGRARISTQSEPNSEPNSEPTHIEGRQQFRKAYKKRGGRGMSVVR